MDTERLVLPAAADIIGLVHDTGCGQVTFNPRLPDMEDGIAGIAIERLDDDLPMFGKEAAHLSRVFDEQIFAVLTPLSVDPAHPFPYVSNLSLNLATVVRPLIQIPLPVGDPKDEVRRRRYGDFSGMNRRWNTTASATTHASA